ncbi:MAG TPA: alpha/beta hydrolase [Streptosporangiaceae bacterium]|jgi:pimeloyl-ACP methyl ester carboxylesterase
MNAAPVAAQVRDGADPPVVLVSGLGEPGGYWQPVVSRLRAGSLTVSYDRPGIGASPPRPGPRLPLPYSALAAELAALLERLRIGAPAVLAGHSMGSLIIRVFAAAWPARVAGMVHVDGSDPRLLAAHPDSSTDGAGSGATEVDFAAGAAEVLPTGFPELPSIVLARTPGRSGSSPDAPALDRAWQLAQASLARRSGSALIIAADSGHRVPAEAPGLAAFAIDQVVLAVRDGRRAVALDPAQAEAAGGTLTPLVPAASDR